MRRRDPVEPPPAEPLGDLTADVAPEDYEAVTDFMAEAAQQNEAANEAVPDRKNKPGPYISFEHVYKSFGDFVVLEDVSFSILPGETLCILGRSGVGKSVSLQMLMGFYKPDKGKIIVAGEDIVGLNEKQLQEVRRRSPWSSRTARSSTPSRSARTSPSPPRAEKTSPKTRSSRSCVGCWTWSALQA